MLHNLSDGAPADGWPATDPDDIPCCDSSAWKGHEDCTCWKPVYDLEQQPVRPHEPTQSQPKMCADCAYRPKSPERQGDPEHEGDEDLLENLAASGRPFWCHQGIRRPIKYVHPTGAEVPGHPANYCPPMIDGRPYQADGSPALLCGGWSALNRSHDKENNDAG